MCIALDQKVYLQQTSIDNIGYGVNLVKAMSVSDDLVGNQKVCIIDTGYDLNHPDLPSTSTGAEITGTSYGNLNWFEDGRKCIYFDKYIFHILHFHVRRN